MTTAPLPADETERIRALRALQVLDTPPEERFERITRVAAQVFDVPIVLVSLVDVNRQWFKSCFGLNDTETSRDVSFCAHAILQRDALVVPDARLDPRFADNALVTGSPFVRFYAGQPLASRDGHNLGTLCIIDRKPRTMNAAELGLLRELAKWAETELNTMELGRALALVRETNQRLEDLVKLQDRYISIVTHDFRTALTGIQGFSELIGSQDLTVDEIREFSRDIYEDAQRLNRMITDMINLKQTGGDPAGPRGQEA